jgi:hypothetical protein
MTGRIVVGTSSRADPGFVAEWYREILGQDPGPEPVRAEAEGSLA